MPSPSTHGIHSLPAETLSDIFRFAVAAVTPDFWRITPAPSRKTELERLANAPLLILSRVCSPWHDVAINNPTFWSDVEVNGMVSGCDTRSALGKTIRLLSARLERTRDVPLSVSLTCEDIDQLFHPHIFHLLAQHSERWETLRVGCTLKGLDTLVLRGGLPRLKTLRLNLGAFETVDFFGIAPCLDDLGICASLLHTESLITILRRKQLRSLGCRVMFWREFEEAISLLPQLPVATDFYLAIDLDRRIFGPHYPMPLRLPSITALISTLSCSSRNEFHAHHMSSALSQIFAGLTLPKLRQVDLGCSVYPGLMLKWPHTPFLALCERSDLGRCLKTLRIAEVRITERDLLEICSVLEALEHLEVGDAPGNIGQSNDSESVLITDSLLRAMTCVPAADCLVPHLSYFAFVSRLAFTQSLVVDLVTSRLARISDSESPILFHICIHPLPESDAYLDSAVHSRLWGLAAGNKQFVYQSGEKYILIEPKTYESTR
ncbi:hypothetical protein C8R44DRAFT_864374 [Mycena epipterygia]|nr:hypothetical protein C8R44DRAFT_864374 [Mycena epipterygia]